MLSCGTIDDKIDAIEWLAEQKEPLAVVPLLRCLSSADQGLQERAAWALGEIGDQRAVVPLVNALEALDADIVGGKLREGCRQCEFERALQRLTGRKYGNDLPRWKELRNLLTSSS
jgi:HEAT repeat protein